MEALQAIKLGTNENIMKCTGCRQFLIDGEIAVSLLKTAICENKELESSLLSGALLQPFAYCVEVFIKGKVLLSLSAKKRASFVENNPKMMLGELSSYIMGHVSDLSYIGDINYLADSIYCFSSDRGKGISHNCISFESNEIDKKMKAIYDLIVNVNRVLKERTVN